jgi:hypothetical protein
MKLAEVDRNELVSAISHAAAFTSPGQQTTRAFDQMKTIRSETSCLAQGGILAGAITLALTAGPARASLVIVPTFDASITSSLNAAQIEGSINGAINAINPVPCRLVRAGVIAPGGVRAQPMVDFSNAVTLILSN